MPDNTSNNDAIGSSRPDCWKCVYFKVSWDPTKPYACTMMGFKSRMLPSIEVRMADGNDCRGFQGKPASHPMMTPPIATDAERKLPQRKRVSSTQVWEA